MKKNFEASVVLGCSTASLGDWCSLFQRASYLRRAETGTAVL